MRGLVAQIERECCGLVGEREGVTAFQLGRFGIVLYGSLAGVALLCQRQASSFQQMAAFVERPYNLSLSGSGSTAVNARGEDAREYCSRR